MSKDYAGGKPVGNNGVPFYDSPPAVKAVATKVRDAATASSILVFNQNTTAIEVAATGGAAYLLWLTQATVDSSVAGTSVVGAATGANFDHVIAPNTIRRFVVPQATIPTSQSSVQGANRQNGLYPNAAIIGVASIATTEYGSSNSY